MHFNISHFHSQALHVSCSLRLSFLSPIICRWCMQTSPQMPWINRKPSESLLPLLCTHLLDFPDFRQKHKTKTMCWGSVALFFLKAPFKSWSFSLACLDTFWGLFTIFIITVYCSSRFVFVLYGKSLKPRIKSFYFMCSVQTDVKQSESRKVLPTARGYDNDKIFQLASSLRQMIELRATASLMLMLLQFYNAS